MAAALRNEPGLQVQLVDGSKGELTVLVDGREVARKQGGPPPVDEVVAAVRKAGAATAGAHA